ncbi:MAG: hypothetical protein O2986_05570 [Actinomycetota bacterium]|nr:hypothetical protein [Actinomycetota bacterium]
MGLFRKKSITSKLDPSDIIIASASERAMRESQIGDLILDYQGGGIAGSAAALAYMRSAPTEDEIERAKEITRSVLELLTEVGAVFNLLNPLLIVKTLEVLGREGQDLSSTEYGVLEATATAVCHLAGRRDATMDDVMRVVVVGTTLGVRTATWESLR